MKLSTTPNTNNIENTIKTVGGMLIFLGFLKFIFSKRGIKLGIAYLGLSAFWSNVMSPTWKFQHISEEVRTTCDTIFLKKETINKMEGKLKEIISGKSNSVSLNGKNTDDNILFHIPYNP